MSAIINKYNLHDNDRNAKFTEGSAPPLFSQTFDLTTMLYCVNW